MLAQSDCNMNAVSLEPKLKLLVQLPAKLSDFMNEQGYAPTCQFEHRTAARLRVRCEAALSITSSPAFLQRTDFQLIVLIKDLSRSGIGILCHQQLFPVETFSVHLLDREVYASVVRCRKLGIRCYEVGASISSVLSRKS